MRYLALIDGSERAYEVVFPDLPGGAAMGVAINKAMTLPAEALGAWIGGRNRWRGSRTPDR